MVGPSSRHKGGSRPCRSEQIRNRKNSGLRRHGSQHDQHEQQRRPGSGSRSYPRDRRSGGSRRARRCRRLHAGAEGSHFHRRTRHRGRSGQVEEVPLGHRNSR